ncbi:polyketide cyclase [Sulfitobacter sp. BDSS02]|nr:polyketide cyclase [Sulfitobacter sp. BDSS02]MBR9848367.1 SRPBCC family protein [Paracoccaceae bacterium]
MDFDPETDLTFTRTLPVAPETVWACWTTPEHIKQFFVPRPHRVTACDIDLRPGGRFDTTFEVEGNVMENRGVYLEIDKHRRLVFTDAYTEGWKPAPEPFLTAIIELEHDDEGGTLYTATARHRSAEAREQHEKMGFIEGWNIVADQLIDYAKTL